MKKIITAPLIFVLLSANLLSCNSIIDNVEDESREMYDGAALRELQEYEMTKDPATGRVPKERLWAALDYTEMMKRITANRGVELNWVERGPIYDSVGPNNGNGRGGNAGFTGGYTSGRISAFLIDRSDATGNTAFTGGVCGGLWKCTNFLSTIPNWQPVNDYFDNMAITSICQDPTNPDVMYFSTGEPYYAIDAVTGLGIFKSTDHGATWTRLVNTSSWTRVFKLDCDAEGNVYVGTRGYGLRRSKDKGVSWTDITPTGLTSTSCTDFDFTANGKLYISFGIGTNPSFRYTNSPGTVTSASWLSSSGGLPSSGAYRMELAASGDTVYAITTSTAYNVDYCYRSVDGGVTFSKRNATAYTTGVSNTQGWYNITLVVDPANCERIIMGGLDAYVSNDGGASVSRMTYWVGPGPFVHADHHFMQMYPNGSIVIGSDGGLFYSNDGGNSFKDKNRNLSLKQFYSCAIHPTQSAYILGGAQDNGVHQLKQAGLGYSTEVTGGDGGFVHINQVNPAYQYGSYVYNVYRRSTNGGSSWSPFTLGSSSGSFINPFDMDDNSNKMFACWGSNAIIRWNNPATATSSSNIDTTQLTLNGLAGYPTAFKVSPYTSNLVYIGSAAGKLLRLNNANATTAATVVTDAVSIGSASFPSGTISCIAVGSNDNNLLVTFSNYGVSNVWISNNAGANWTAIDGNLPDMPVRWAVFHPTDNNKILLATEAGVYTTLQANGSLTQWLPSPGFPTVRTDMLKVRSGDNTVVAATHGRGMFTANILQVLPLHNLALRATAIEGGIAHLSWTADGIINTNRFHLEYSIDGIQFTEIANLPFSTHTYRHHFSGNVGYYRIKADEPGYEAVYSNTVVVKSSGISGLLKLKVLPNPASYYTGFVVSSTEAGSYRWVMTDMQGRTVRSGNGYLNAGDSYQETLQIQNLAPGNYKIRFVQGRNSVTSSMVKL